MRVKRYNRDKSTNNNGYSMIEMCKSLDMYIVNGRIGKDREIGCLTFNETSTIDYAVVSPELFPKVNNFEVDVVDKFLSDKHSPICITFNFDEISQMLSLAHELTQEKSVMQH